MDQVKWEYVAEGRANVVFRMTPLGSVKEDSGIFADALFRVPKATPGATPHSYDRLQHYRDTIIEPAVGAQFLVPQLLVEIPDHQAQILNQKRDPRHKDKSVILSGRAMLIQDMSPLSANQLGLEFKPKWLAQSPIAPADATRCRTCAREAYRNGQKLQAGKPISPPVCPLGLVHNDPAVVLDTIKLLAPKWSKSDQIRLREAFEKTQVFLKLRKLQMDGDPGNTMFTNPESPKFGLAMTLRDCTCFVRLSKDATDPKVEIKLADTDEKNWEYKQEYWQKSHNNLIDNGFYHEKEMPPIETHCLLLRDANKKK